jgi:ABC-type enterochelin transport system ATPase subunit
MAKPKAKKTPEEIFQTKQNAAAKKSAKLKGRIPWNKGLNWKNPALKGRIPYNKGQMVVGSKRWKIQQKRIEKLMIKDQL